MKNLPLHHLQSIFYASFSHRWKKNRRVQIVASRYGHLSLDSSFIHDKFLCAISGCTQFGFIVVALGFDDASENRTAVKLLADLSVNDILSEKIRKLPSAGDILEHIPLETKIAFRDPIIQTIIFFFLGICLT